MANTFQQDVDFLNRFTDTIVLGDPERSAIVLTPEFQGRVMTSTAGGPEQHSFGWINYDLIQSQTVVPQINLYGGEERFWLAPEGGRYSIFFPPSELESPLDFADWRVPKCIDTDSFNVVVKDSDSVKLQHESRLQNRFGFEFDIRFDRTVRLLGVEDVCETLECEPQQLKSLNVVAHQSENCLSNVGSEVWRRETGLLSIWVLCMNSPSKQATLVVPYRSGSEMELGSIVNADYFGELGRDRFWVDEASRLIFLKGDGDYRSKLGLTYPRVRPILGAWDQDRKVLTVIWFNLPTLDEVIADSGLVKNGNRIEYVNNVWRVLEDEYNGDVINGYNDGPNESGGKLGGFFELESLSPALALAPSCSYTHVHRTIRMQASSDQQLNDLDSISRRVFGVGLADIERVFG